MQLLVNIDHVATLRNARGEGRPDPVEAARICEESGAAGIVFHLREDRRHIGDNDVYALQKSVKGILDFEMAATEEMLEICERVSPHLATLVPESRQELTTEGGLMMRRVADDFSNRVVPRLKKAGIEMSLFVDPVEEDIRICHELNVEAVELHTGTFANADPSRRDRELQRLHDAAVLAHRFGMKVNAGHGLDFGNIKILLDAVPHLNDISIGHALISDALFNGLGNTVRRMAGIIQNHSQLGPGS
jgi:pyridoxine 5-phosphate synthase